MFAQKKTDMKRQKRIAIIIAIILGALILSILINLCITLIQESTYPLKFSTEVQKYAKEFNVPEYVILAVIKADSDFDENKTYEDGAKGLMHITQIKFAKFASLEHLSTDATYEDLIDPDVSIRFGTYYLRYLFNRYRSWDTAIVAYSAGEATTDEWLKNPEYAKNGTTLKEIPLSKTEDYLNEVNDAIDYYKDTYYRNGAFTK